MHINLFKFRLCGKKGVRAFFYHEEGEVLRNQLGKADFYIVPHISHSKLFISLKFK